MALWTLCLADLPAMADKVDVEGEDIFGRHHRFKDVMRLFCCDFGTDKAQPFGDPKDVCVYRHDWQAH